MLTVRFQHAGIEICECHEELWKNDEKRIQAASGGWIRFGFLCRVLRVYTRLIWKYFTEIGDYDVMIIGYPGHFDMFVGKLFCLLRHKPLIWDIYLSIYLICLDRGIDTKSPLTFKGLHWVERIAARLPDRILLETQAYINWFAEHYRIPHDRFRVAPFGADDRLFHPQEQLSDRKTGNLVVFYGTFHNNSGVLYIVEAAKLLCENTNITFELIGKGPDFDEVQRRINDYGLVNVKLFDWMDKEPLIERISRADLCLGSFGTSPQSYISVHNKIYESMAMSKAVITGDSPAIRDVLRHEIHIYLVERASPIALAGAILELFKDDKLRISISDNGHKLYLEKYTNEILGDQLKIYFCELILDH